MQNGLKFITSINDGAKGYGNDKIKLMEDLNENTLGMHWKAKSYKSGFDMQFKEKPFTKMNLLSAISGTYDPLGLVAPFMLEFWKQIQRLCEDDLK